MTVGKVKDFSCGGAMKSGYKQGGAVKSPGFKGATMIADKSKLGISGNKNPGISGAKPVAPNLPTQKLARGGPVAMKKGGSAKC